MLQQLIKQLVMQLIWQLLYATKNTLICSIYIIYTGHPPRRRQTQSPDAPLRGMHHG